MTVSSFTVMKAPRKVSCAVFLLLASLLSFQEAFAGEQSTEFFGEVALGGEYDSNVAVDELDIASNQGDYAWTADASAGVRWNTSESLEIEVWYDFGQTKYVDFSIADLQTHLLGFDLAYDLDKTKLGVTAFYIDSRLDGGEFLTMQQLSPSVSRFVSRRWFLRGAAVYSDTSFENRTGRDATRYAVEADAYFFRKGSDSYFNLGYRYRDEDADAERFDYTSSVFKVRWIQRFPLFDRVNRLEIGLKYEARDYSGTTPSIRQQREDDKYRVNVEYQLPFTEKLRMEVYAGYSDYQSNLESADYAQDRVGSRLVYEW
jgi:hypothetical protein